MPATLNPPPHQKSNIWASQGRGRTFITCCKCLPVQITHLLIYKQISTHSNILQTLPVISNYSTWAWKFIIPLIIVFYPVHVPEQCVCEERNVSACRDQGLASDLLRSPPSTRCALCRRRHDGQTTEHKYKWLDSGLCPPIILFGDWILDSTNMFQKD